MRSARRKFSLLGALLLSSVLACDGPLRLVVVEAPPLLEQAKGPEAAGTSAQDVDVAGSGGMGAVSAAPAGGEAGASAEVSLPFVASYVSHAYPGQYVRHRSYEGFISPIDRGTADAADASFEITAGLYDPACISFKAVNQPDSYLRHSGSRIYLHVPDDLRLFLADATYCAESGLADPSGVSFRSSNYPDRFLHVRSGSELWTDDFLDTPAFASESTFYRETALIDRSSD